MSPELHLLPDAIAWVVHPAAGFAIAHFASVLYSRQGKEPAYILRAAAIIAVLAVLGAGWVVHPAAGMLLGYFGARAFYRWREHLPALLVALAASALFMVMGAEWMIFPFMVMGLIWLFSSPWTSPGRRAGERPAGTDLQALPEQAGGMPMVTAGQAVPVQVPTVTAAPAAKAVPADAFTALQLDDRLPGDIRAQLVALDFRTVEALTHLKALGQDGSEGAYVARTIRDEYAPSSVRAYLNLPRTRADVTPIEDGKTGRDLLREQLDILLNAVQDILDSTLRAGGQELLTNRRFLQDKFGKPKKDLDV